MEVIAGRILGYFSHGPTFFVREILDGIVAKLGGNYICSIYRHCQALQQSRVNYHVAPLGASAPKHVEIEEFLGEPAIFQEISG